MFVVLLAYSLSLPALNREGGILPTGCKTTGGGEDITLTQKIGNFSHSLKFFWSDSVQGGLSSQHKDSPPPTNSIHTDVRPVDIISPFG